MAEAFETFTSRAIPLPADNVDTDQIVPARYLKVTDKEGLAEALFHDWRFTDNGRLKDPPFVLDRPGIAGRRILLAGDNFGSGSSREHAAWALFSWGIRAILSTGGQSPEAQIAAIQHSGWASSGYPSLPALYQQVTG